MSGKTPDLEYLLAQAKHSKMTLQEKEEQRRSFAYGNTNIENHRVTRQMVDEEAEKLPRPHVELGRWSPPQ